jgi:hypothetical protein
MMAILLGRLDPNAGTTFLQHTINNATQSHVPEALNPLIPR